MVDQELQSIGTPTMDVYFDSSKLLRKLSVTFGGGASAVEFTSVQMTFDNYGTSVDMGPPGEFGCDQLQPVSPSSAGVGVIHLAKHGSHQVLPDTAPTSRWTWGTLAELVKIGCVTTK